MKVIRDMTAMQAQARQWQQKGKRIGFVPTMGALHEGHISLLDVARKHCDILVCSIFVNPAQFAPGEDLDTYPRTEAKDLQALEKKHIDAVYIPDADAMYPEGDSCQVSTGQIGQILEGTTRPHFFDGVALVITKLFHQVCPDVAVFGEKDFQQLHIIRRLITDFNFGVEIIGAPIIREDDGLARSSRNLRLSKTERTQAPALYHTLCEIRQKIMDGISTEEAISQGVTDLNNTAGFRVDYLELCNSETLQPITSPTESGRLLAAAFLGDIRLIDNIAI